MLHVRDVTSCVGFSLHPHPATVIVAILNYLDGEILEYSIHDFRSNLAQQ
jgi:hypothetical protein